MKESRAARLLSGRKLERSCYRWALKIANVKVPTLDISLSSSDMDDIRNLIKAGDILLVDNCNFPLAQLGARLVGSKWSHSAIYAGNGKVIDCGRRARVEEISLDEFLDTSAIAIFRVKDSTAADIENMVNYARSCLGKPFNCKFNLESKNSLYCTQLVANALKCLSHPIELPVERVLGKPVLTETIIANAPQLELIYCSSPGLARAFLAHFPSLSAGCLGALCALAIGRNLMPFGSILGILIFLGLSSSKDSGHKKSERCL